MKPTRLIGLACCEFMRHGCFNKSDHPAEDADRSKAYVPTPKPDAPTGEAPTGEPGKANQ